MIISVIIFMIGLLIFFRQAKIYISISFNDTMLLNMIIFYLTKRLNRLISQVDENR